MKFKIGDYVKVNSTDHPRECKSYGVIMGYMEGTSYYMVKFRTKKGYEEKMNDLNLRFIVVSYTEDELEKIPHETAEKLKEMSDDH